MKDFPSAKIREGGWNTTLIGSFMFCSKSSRFDNTTVSLKIPLVLLSPVPGVI